MKLLITILKEIQFTMIVVCVLIAAVMCGAVAAACYYSIVNYSNTIF